MTHPEVGNVQASAAQASKELWERTQASLTLWESLALALLGRTHIEARPPRPRHR